MAKQISTTGIDKLVSDVKGIGDLTERITAMTSVIARLRAAVGEVSEARSEAIVTAKAEGVSYATLARAAGMTTGRMSALGAGRGGYVRKADRTSAPVGLAAVPAAADDEVVAEVVSGDSELEPVLVPVVTDTAPQPRRRTATQKVLADKEAATPRKRAPRKTVATS